MFLMFPISVLTANHVMWLTDIILLLPSASAIHTPKSADRNSQLAPGFFVLRGVADEVPRWSVMHSLLSEITRLIPPTDECWNPNISESVEAGDGGSTCGETVPATLLTAGDLHVLPSHLDTEQGQRIPSRNLAHRESSSALFPPVDSTPGHQDLTALQDSTIVNSTTKDHWDSLEELEALLML
jgi:hypothetical protein